MFRLLLLICLLAIGCTPYQIDPNSAYADIHKYPTAYYYHNFTKTELPQPKILASKIKVSEVKYQLLPDKRGFWTGLVEGEGEYNLRLNFYQKNRLLKSKHIGSRSLMPEEGPMWFKFNSPLPKLKHYTWKIEAYQQ